MQCISQIRRASLRRELEISDIVTVEEVVKLAYLGIRVTEELKDGFLYPLFVVVLGRESEVQHVSQLR